MRLALVYITFPKKSETFLLREANSLLKISHENSAKEGEEKLEIDFFSLFGGGKSFKDKSIKRLGISGIIFALINLLFYSFTKPKTAGALWKLFKPEKKSTIINYLENLIGIAGGITWAQEFKDFDIVHAQWGTAPAMAARAAQIINPQVKYSMGLHAFDLYEHGGDAWLKQKTRHAQMIVSSNLQAHQEVKRRFPAANSFWIRRGLIFAPNLSLEEKKKENKNEKKPLFISIGRLMEKKRFDLFIALMNFLKKSGMNFEAEIIGDGPLKNKLQSQIDESNLNDCVKLRGWCSQSEIIELLQRAKFFFFTGNVAKNGDRDGFPNVIAEAFLHGAVVIARNAVGVSEGVENGKTGVLLNSDEPQEWKKQIDYLMSDEKSYEVLREGAFLWVKENFDAQKNAQDFLRHLKNL